MSVARRSHWMALAVIAAVLVVPSLALAGDQHVYGDPGSGDFSVALAAAADSSGNAYVMGAFYGQFQGATSNEWDLWIARIADDGSFVWLRTFDAGVGDLDYPALGNWPGSAPWTEDDEMEHQFTRTR